MNNAKPKILVVEDDSDSLIALCTILDNLGYEPVGFKSGQETLDGIKDTKFDLALLDIMMPHMNGYELMAKLKELDAFKSIPFIMVTAKDEDASIIEGYRHGVDYYITKPYTSKQLEFGIQLYLNKSMPEKA